MPGLQIARPCLSFPLCIPRQECPCVLLPNLWCLSPGHLAKTLGASLGLQKASWSRERVSSPPSPLCAGSDLAKTMVTILDMATIHSLLGLVGGTVPFLGFLLVFSDGLCPGRSDCSERCVGCVFAVQWNLGSHSLLCWLTPVGQVAVTAQMSSYYACSSFEL